MDNRDVLVSMARYLSDFINESTESPVLRRQARQRVMAAMERAKEDVRDFLEAAAGTEEAAARRR